MVFKDVIIVGTTDGDWYGIYLQEGEMFTLWGEDHQVYIRDFAQLVNHHHLNEVFQSTVDSEWIEEQGGRFPNQYEDIPSEAFV